ncbi:MAG: cadherin-like beta sandwich domain-containing protein, partial [Spirochaetales bacterium]|nr:cadherin-like beta sandwich domain-containing protein [Spirochaetales bacterium]
NVGYDVSSISLSYKTEESAVAKVSAENPEDISLNVGENKINIAVTAEDGKTTKNYSVNVIRAAKPIEDCKLTSISVNGKNLTVKPEMEVEVDTSSVRISVTSENLAHIVTIAGEKASDVVLNLIGENLLEIKVDSGNGAFITYKLKVTVNKKSNAALTSVKVGNLSIGTIQSNMGLNVKEKTVTVTVEANEHAKSVMIDGVETKTASVTVAAADTTFCNKSVKITLTDNEGNPVTYYLTLTYQEIVTGKIIVHAYGYPYIYYWTTSADAKVEAMTDEGEDWYTFTINETTKNIIFRKKGGNDWEGQTVDLSRTEGEWWYKDGKWSAYPEDKVPPTVSMVTPVAGANVSGDAVIVEAEANDDREMAYVDFYVDGKKAKSVKALPYSFQWNSTYVKNGTHTLKAVAYDASGNNTSTEEITVTATNSNLAPEAVIGGSKRAPVSITKNYRGTGSKDLNGEIVSYKWSITGGATLDSDSASSVNITFPAAVSTYTLTLTVTDDLGATDTTSMDIETYVKSQTKWDFREETIYFAMTTRFYDGDKSNNVHCWDENAATPEDDPAWRGDFKG